jgi:hypothetical protein
VTKDVFVSQLSINAGILVRRIVHDSTNRCFKSDNLNGNHLPSKSSTQEYRGADKSLARPTSRCILFDG